MLADYNFKVNEPTQNSMYDEILKWSRNVMNKEEVHRQNYNYYNPTKYICKKCGMSYFTICWNCNS